MSVNQRFTVYGSYEGFGLASPAHTFSHRPEFLRETLNLDSVGFRSPSHRMRATFSVVDVRGVRGTASRLAWAVNRGRLESFRVTWPQYMGSVEVPSAVVASEAVAGSETVSIRGLGASGYNGLRVVSFVGHSKVYWLEPFVSLVGGVGTFKVEPALVEGVSAGVAVDSRPTSDVVFVVSSGVRTLNSIRAQGTVTVQEKL